MQENLYEMADKVRDESSFVRFLFALASDWGDEQRKEEQRPLPPYGPGANGWENGTIGTFLEAASAWARDSEDGTQSYRKPENPWTRVAHIILAGKFYE